MLDQERLRDLPFAQALVRIESNLLQHHIGHRLEVALEESWGPLIFPGALAIGIYSFDRAQEEQVSDRHALGHGNLREDVVAQLPRSVAQGPAGATVEEEDLLHNFWRLDLLREHTKINKQ